jgi:uncharacterized protein YqkB
MFLRDICGCEGSGVRGVDKILEKMQKNNITNTSNIPKLSGSYMLYFSQ